MPRLRRYVVPLFSIALVLTLGFLGTALASTSGFYLKADGVPQATTDEAAPSAGTLANYDPGRDDDPGLLLQKSSIWLGETDPTKYQLWLTAPGELVLDGPATLTLWSAMKDFDSDKKGHIKAYLLDCDASGTDCSKISDAGRGANPWSRDGGWVERELDLGTVQHTIAVGRSLAVKLVVTDLSHDDMWLAYDTVSYPSALNVQLGTPTTTTTTTTTTLPPTTTTSTTTTTTPPPPPTTTTTPATGTTTTTTSTTGAPAATTTTTTIPVGNSSPATTTTSTTEPPEPIPPPTTTATILETPTPPPSAPDPTPPDEDLALGPLPDSTSGNGSSGFSNLLLDGLELVIPPAVASSLLSPLLLLESVFGAFVATGRGLLIPGLLLVVGVLWTEGRRRRNTVLIATITQGRAQS